MTRNLRPFSSLLALVAAVAGCSGSTPTAVSTPDMMKAACGTFTPTPECRPGDLPVHPLSGDRQMVLSSLQVAGPKEGFDLNCDGKVDNKLSALGGLANGMIATTFATQRNIVVPIEMFGYTGADSACTKFAFYLGRVNEDRDTDGVDTNWTPGKSDCDDTDKTINPGATENPNNKVDDDCDGIADNPMKGAASTNKMDYDQDGQTMADGDCDERTDTPAHLSIAKARKRGATEICDNGIDDDCDGIADNGPGCDAFADNKVAMHVQAQSFTNAPADPSTIKPADLIPAIVFGDGVVKNGSLTAGPDVFALAVPLAGASLQLTLSGAHVKMTLTDMAKGSYAMSGVLGGVLEAVTLAQIHVVVNGFLTADQSLLDGVFVGALGKVLLLNMDKDGNLLPDIDVDGDGLETFWQDPSSMVSTDAGAAQTIVDRCKDGDGTVYMGRDCPFTCKSLDGKMMAVKDCKGKTAKDVQFLFVDGLSMAINFTAVPATLKDVTAK